MPKKQNPALHHQHVRFAGIEVDPISRTPYCSYRRSPRCPIPNCRARRNFVSRWSSLFVQARSLQSWPKNLAATSRGGTPLAKLRANGESVNDADVARLTPLLHEHINMLGRYSFSMPEAVAKGELRHLRDPTDPSQT